MSRACLRAALAAAATTVLVGARAHAEDPVPGAVMSRPTLNVHAAPLFGVDGTTQDGWSEVVVSIDNVGGAVKRGRVELSSSLSYGNRSGFLSEAPFTVQPGRSVVVQMPTHGFQYQSPTLSVVVHVEGGEVLPRLNVSSNGQVTPMLVDISQPSRLAVTMRNWPVPVTWNPHTYSGSTLRNNLSVGAPSFDRSTGDPILPAHAAGYAPASAVIIRSDLLARLEATPLDALVSWVIGGGTLAVIVNRPEDMRGPVLEALVGGAFTTTPPPPALLHQRSQSRPSTGKLFPEDPLEEAAPQFELFRPIRAVRPSPSARPGPPPEVRGKLEGYAGGNLTPSVFGASAPYGAGEVHLLGFDPTVSPLVDDVWVQSRVAELVEHAWDHRAGLVIEHGGGERYNGRSDEIRRALDPNENFRPALGISAILLVIYSVLVGPVVFLRATRRGKPLSPLGWAPVLSAATFGAIVLVGLAGKGWRGRARHLTLVELGAGVSRGSVQRFRGFFTSEARALTIPSTDASSVLQVTTNDSASSDAQSSLLLDRNGATLQNIVALPWQTIVVREDGFRDLPGGVTLLTAKDGSVDVVNRTGQELKDVLLSVPGDQLRYFPSLKNGDRLHGADGRALFPMVTRRVTTAGTRHVHPLNASLLGSSIGGKDGDRVTQSWSPFESANGEVIDWWPDAVPALLAEMEGGEGAKRDAELRVESDRVFLRVVGRGGAP